MPGKQETGRPGTSGRPFTGASGRPFTGAAPVAPVSRAAVSRAGSMRPVTGSMEKIRVMSRPITQQGLSGMKTGGSGRSRMVQDKSYFMVRLHLFDS
ncbi:Intraflagellar transport protein 74 [Amphibalanus amphitrite]|uniref:Intraflagellar transport protein 74 n=1 Tax=Amphibalanus amphitrite TaxID=1232801 RepID=A0A6A4VW35_AMPAM|nr:Intraflagellar transport protein 74 [Amphibalanus amphitrite]